MSASPPLPIQLTPLIGREREATEVLDLLLTPSVRLVTLTGPGGVGKTRLGLEVAKRVADHFPDGVWLVRLEAIRDIHLVLATIAQVVGIAESTAEDLADRVARWMGPGRHLVLIDNFEQVAEASPVLSQLLQACPLLKIFVTSRTPLAIVGEREFPVGPLAIPGASQSVLLETVRNAASVRLFVNRACEVQPAFVLNESNQADIVAICRRLDGLPLAIELAAARVTVMTVSTLRERLSNQLAVLRGSSRSLPGRQKTMRDTIAWSYELLDAESAAIFRTIGVFSGGFTFGALSAVLRHSDCDSIDDDQLLDLLEVLVDQSLVRRIESGTSDARFGLFQTVNEFALDELERVGEAPDRYRAHAAWVVDLATEAEPNLVGPEQLVWLDRLDLEHDNIRAALTFAAGTSHIEPGLSIAGRLWRFWWVRGYQTEGYRWLLQMIDLHTGSDSRDLALALRGAGSLAEELGKVTDSHQFYDRGLVAARSVGDRLQEATVIMGLGMLSANTGNFDKAINLYAEAQPIFEETGNKRGIMLCIGNSATVSFYRGDLSAAEVGFKRAREILLEIDDRRSATIFLSNLGAVYLEQHRFDEALEVNLQVTKEALALGDELGQANGSINVAESYANLGDLDNAAAAAEQALEIARRLGLTRTTGFAHGTMAQIEQSRGNLAGAAEYVRWGLDELRAANDKLGVSTLANTMAELALLAGLPSESAECYGLSEVLLDDVAAKQSPQAAEVRARNLTEIQTRIGEDALTTALEAGKRLSLDDFASRIDEFMHTVHQQSIDPTEAVIMAEFGLARSDLTLLHLFLAGKSHAEIATEMMTTPAVIVNRIGHLYTRTGTNSRATLTAWAFQAGVA